MGKGRERYSENSSSAETGRSVEKLIEVFTDPGDVVIDPCCGSGSTLRAAVESGRSAYGFEIDRNFYERAKNEMLVFERDEQLSIEDFPEVMP